MEKTDAKVRLFLELSNPHPIQILNYIPLKEYKDWTPEKMYDYPKSQYYYAFINDEELISRMKKLIKLNDPIEKIESVVENIKEQLNSSRISIEFNGCNIEDYDNLEKKKKKMQILNENNEENIQNNINIISNLEEEKYVVFCRFFLKNFGFIHSFDKLNKEDLNKIYEKPIVYALKGKIKTLMHIKRKEFESKKGENDIGSALANEEEKGKNKNDTQSKKDSNEKNNILSKGIDGHWFLVNSYDTIEFLAFIKYKEKLIIQPDQDKLSTSNSQISNNPSMMSNLSQSATQKYSNPHIFSFIIKDTKKFVTVYQNKSCKYHHNKNEFICKDCGDFCCLECFEEKSKNNNHYGHKISLVDDVAAKFEEDAKFLDERIQYLKGILENEINDKKNEILATKVKNEQTVNAINTENDNIRSIIKKQQIERAKVLGFLGNEALRILNDFNLKLRYIKILNDKGDMSTYLTNYFFFEKFYKTEIRKNLKVLKKKILETEERFNEYNEKLINLIDEIKKTI